MINTLGDRIQYAIKSAWGTQRLFSENAKLAQNSIVNYVKNKRVPDLMTLKTIARMCNVDFGWITEGAINKNHHAAIVAAYQSGQLFDNKPISAEFLAERLGVPEQFIQAIIAGDISPSQEFYDRLMHDGFGFKATNDLHDRFEAEVKTIADRRAAQPREQVIEDEIEDLKGKLDEIYEWYDRLQKKSDALEKTALEQKGHIDALEKMIGFSINKGERKDNFDLKNHESS